jgi:hypothetical protein
LVIDYLTGNYLRSYQLAWLRDANKFRVALKPRQVGFSDVIALEMVLVASGLMPGVLAHNCNIVSKKEADAYDVITKAKKWVDILRMDARMAEHLRTSVWSASEIVFTRTGYRIVSDTQNPDAGRGKTGHLYLDEYGFYQYQMQIWTGAVPSTFSNPQLRVSVISTPNGTGDHYHELWSDHAKYPEWSRHYLDVYEAAAAGFPIDIEAQRRNFTPDLWAQEMECKFIGGEHEYFPAELMREAHGARGVDADATLWLGIDTASVVDTTAVQCIWLQRDGAWLGDTYILEHLQYETDTIRKRPGQDLVLDAIIQTLRPTGAVFDVTGDMARKVRGFPSIFKIINQQRGGDCRILPQTIDREWKDREVEEIKQAMMSSRLKFVDGRVDYIFSRANAGQFAGERFAEQAAARSLVATCFTKSDFPILVQDFRKIHRKWLGPNRTTFDAARDGTGHADAFWATVLGYSVARVQRVGQPVRAPKQAEYTPTAPDYMRYM